MWRMRRNNNRAGALKGAAALLLALAMWAVAPTGARAGEDHAQILAAEILVTRADLAQIAKPDLPLAHRAGFVERIGGAMGLIPWLLVVAGDEDGAGEAAGWAVDWSGGPGEVKALDRFLAKLSARHPLDIDAYDIGITHADLAEARAIHDAYCAGCHDGEGTGEPDAELVARDLFWMARDEVPEQFLARLVNGVKGDESIGFVNPLTTRQVAALWKLYTFD